RQCPLFLCRFLDAGMTTPSTRCGGRRPKSAKARSRGKLGTGGATGAMGVDRKWLAEGQNALLTRNGRRGNPSSSSVLCESVRYLSRVGHAARIPGIIGAAVTWQFNGMRLSQWLLASPGLSSLPEVL